MTPNHRHRSLPKLEQLGSFARFCVVGGSGVLVDMVMLYLLSSPHWGNLNVTLSKICAAETALLNNFLWNECWTFRRYRPHATPRRGLMAGVLRRALHFHVICGLGIVWSLILLSLFYGRLRFSLYAANVLAILLVTAWNFLMNASFNWRRGSASSNSVADNPPIDQNPKTFGQAQSQSIKQERSRST